MTPEVDGIVEKRDVKGYAYFSPFHSAMPAATGDTHLKPVMILEWLQFPLPPPLLPLLPIVPLPFALFLPSFLPPLPLPPFPCPPLPFPLLLLIGVCCLSQREALEGGVCVGGGFI